MLTLKTFPHLHRPISFPTSSPLKSLFFSPKPSPPLPISFSTTTKSSAAAAAAASMEETIEHVVLFKVKESADPTAMVSQLRSLTSLGLTTHLAVAPVLRHRSPAASALAFTHLLHSRYRSKPDLATYSGHPDHVAVVKNHVLPIADDIMAVDWVSNAAALSPPPPGSAVRLTLAKPKEGSSAAEIVEVIAGAGAVEGLLQLSYGENFSPARAKGYEVAMIAVFPGIEGMDRSAEGTEAAKEKARPLLESVIVLDYVVPAPADATSSSL